MPSPLIVPDASTTTPSTMPTRAQYRQALAQQLGMWAPGVIAPTLPGGEPGRWVTVDDFKDDEWPRDEYEALWVYATNGDAAGEQRRVRTEGFEGPYGAFAVSHVFPDNLAPGSTVEITTPLPATRSGLTKGLNQIVGEALDRILIRARIPLLGNGTHQFGLSDYPFLTRQEQTDGIYDWRWQGQGQDQNLPSRRTSHDYAVLTDGPTVTLSTRRVYGADEPFELSVLVPASNLTFDGGDWAWNVGPLEHDDDMACAPIGWVVTCGMVIALDYLLTRNEADRTIPEDQPTETRWAAMQTFRARRRADLSRRLAERWGPAWQKLVREQLPRRDPDPPRQIVAAYGGRLVGRRASGWWR